MCLLYSNIKVYHISDECPSQNSVDQQDFYFFVNFFIGLNLSHIIGAVTEMVPDLIWAPDFFGSQEIWAPRTLGHNRCGPEKLGTHYPVKLVPA